MEPARIETQISFLGVRASAKCVCTLGYSHYTGRRSWMSHGGGEGAAQRGGRIMLLVIPASVVLGLIAAASG